MAEIKDLNVNDNSNTARFYENQFPSTVNDGARALEGMVARGLKDTIDGILETAGTGSAYTLACNRSFTASATMYNGAEFFVRFHAASGDTPTLNVSTTDARKIFWPDGTTLSASDIIANSQGRVKYNSSLSAWVLMDTPVPAKNAFGAIINGKSLTTTITGSAFVPIYSKATGETHKFLKANIASRVSVAIYQYQLANNTAGPTFSNGSFQTFPLNTEVSDPDAIGSVGSNQITLGAGTYLVRAWCHPGRHASVGINRARLYNATDTAVIIQGVNGYAGNINASMNAAHVEGYFTLAGSKAIELQIEVDTSTSTGASALNSGELEVYAHVTVMKLA